MTTVRGTGALVALLAALGGYLAVVEHPRARPPEPAPLLGVPAAAVERVSLQWAGERVDAIRHGDGWTDPNGQPWSGDAVTDVLETLASLRPLMIVDAEPRVPGDYGLGTGGRVELSAAGGRPLLALEVGDRNPAWTGVYVRRAGRSEVLLVGAVLAWELGKLRAAAPSGAASR